MALNGNKPIRLAYSNNKVHYPAGASNGRHVVGGNNVHSSNAHMSAERKRRLRIARIRRLKQQRLMKLRSTTEATTTTLPPTTTTLPPTTTIPTTPELTTSWYDSWILGEGQSSTPGGFTDSILDYNYEYKVDDY